MCPVKLALVQVFTFILNLNVFGRIHFHPGISSIE